MAFELPLDRGMGIRKTDRKRRDRLEYAKI
jgi:hypothetical protein